MGSLRTFAVLHLPPLDSLRFFEAATRHQSFVKAGKELDVSAAARATRGSAGSPVPEPVPPDRRRGVEGLLPCLRPSPQ